MKKKSENLNSHLRSWNHNIASVTALKIDVLLGKSYPCAVVEFNATWSCRKRIAQNNFWIKQINLSSKNLKVDGQIGESRSNRIIKVDGQTTWSELLCLIQSRSLSVIWTVQIYLHGASTLTMIPKSHHLPSISLSNANVRSFSGTVRS